MPSQSGLEEVYSELRRIAAAHLNRRAPSPSLQPTLLVHEAWLRLSGKSWNSKTHFLATASRAMRNILIESIRRRMASKRDGACPTITISSAPEVAAPSDSPSHASSNSTRLSTASPPSVRAARPSSKCASSAAWSSPKSPKRSKFPSSP
ncbi:MAG: hypothetical protein J0L64_22315 [Acidobacteria bacterium]|nr:hypothetical protein [Acidobacteriota bacterium]